MKVVTLLVVLSSLIGGTTALAGSPIALSIGGRSVTAHATPTNKGIRIDGTVRRTLGLGGNGAGAIRVCVYSPKGKMTSCETTRVTYPSRRPLVRSRVGHFSTIVQATPGSTICVGRCPEC